MVEPTAPQPSQRRRVQLDPYLASRHEDSPSPRQREILELLAKGRSDKEIASALALSPATVRSHLQRLYRRFGLRGRAHAIATLWRQLPLENESEEPPTIKFDDLTGSQKTHTVRP